MSPFIRTVDASDASVLCTEPSYVLAFLWCFVCNRCLLEFDAAISCQAAEVQDFLVEGAQLRNCIQGFLRGRGVGLKACSLEAPRAGAVRIYESSASFVQERLRDFIMAFWNGTAPEALT